KPRRQSMLRTWPKRRRSRPRAAAPLTDPATVGATTCREGGRPEAKGRRPGAGGFCRQGWRLARSRRGAPLTTRRRYREAPMAARASDPTTGGDPQGIRPPGQATSHPATLPRSHQAARARDPTTGNATAKPQWPPGQATPHLPAPPGSARLIRLIRRAEVAVERFDDIVDRAVGNGVVDRLRLTPRLDQLPVAQHRQMLRQRRLAQRDQ